jgi:hypothetical protein
MKDRCQYLQMAELRSRSAREAMPHQYCSLFTGVEIMNVIVTQLPLPSYFPSRTPKHYPYPAVRYS